eukprot:SAG11_NODE_2308_length_3545_cov_2.767557_4_plen_367_part_00
MPSTASYMATQLRAGELELIGPDGSSVAVAEPGPGAPYVLGRSRLGLPTDQQLHRRHVLLFRRASGWVARKAETATNPAFLQRAPAAAVAATAAVAAAAESVELGAARDEPLREGDALYLCHNGRPAYAVRAYRTANTDPCRDEPEFPEKAAQPPTPHVHRTSKGAAEPRSPVEPPPAAPVAKRYRARPVAASASAPAAAADRKDGGEGREGTAGNCSRSAVATTPLALPPSPSIPTPPVASISTPGRTLSRKRAAVGDGSPSALPCSTRAESGAASAGGKSFREAIARAQVRWHSSQLHHVLVVGLSTAFSILRCSRQIRCWFCSDFWRIALHPSERWLHAPSAGRSSQERADCGCETARRPTVG